MAGVEVVDTVSGDEGGEDGEDSGRGELHGRRKGGNKESVGKQQEKIFNSYNRDS